MSLDCISVSDAIWDFAREGIQLTEEQLRHARSCRCCASALAEAQASVAAFGCVKPYPAAPDCRSAVMGRISTQRTRLLPAWIYACAVLLVAVMIAGALLWPHRGRPALVQAKRPPEIPSFAPPKMPARAPEPTREMRTVELEKPGAPGRVRPRKPNLRRFEPTPHTHKASPTDTVAPTAPKPGWEIPEPQAAPTVDDSSALAFVTWPIANQQRDSYQYSYAVTDPATGEVTRCSVKREGNAIEIDMESKPAEPETKPAKESKSNEAIRCG